MQNSWRVWRRSRSILVAIVLIISGLGIWLIGVVPERKRSGVSLSTWLSASSTSPSGWGSRSYFRSSSGAPRPLPWPPWPSGYFFSFFVSLGAGVLADAIAPINQQNAGVDPEVVIKHEEVLRITSSFSPMTLYSDATSTILNPMRKTTRSLILMGPMERLSISRFQNPLPLLQSLYHRCSPFDFSGCHHLSLFWNLLRRLHAAGDQNGLRQSA